MGVSMIAVCPLGGKMAEMLSPEAHFCEKCLVVPVCHLCSANLPIGCCPGCVLYPNQLRSPPTLDDLWRPPHSNSVRAGLHICPCGYFWRQEAAQLVMTDQQPIASCWHQTVFFSRRVLRPSPPDSSLVKAKAGTTHAAIV